MRYLLILLLVPLLINCATKEKKETIVKPKPIKRVVKKEKEEMRVEGLMGTLHNWEIQPVINKYFPRIVKCYTKVLERFPFVGGKLTLSFRIKTDGSVKWVYVSSSTVGSQSLHDCIVKEAMKFRFPKPHGGEAEFSYPLELAPAEDKEEAPTLDLSYIEEEINRSMDKLEICTNNKEGFKIGIYFDTSGKVVEAGVSIPDKESNDSIECILNIIKEWSIEPPSTPSKIIFEL